MSLLELYPALDGDFETVIEVPQLEYVDNTNAETRTLHGIRPIDFGTLFHNTLGRGPRTGETVVFKFKSINYRGAFRSWNSTFLERRASFNLGEGWQGTYPKSIVLDIPAGCNIYGGPGRKAYNVGSAPFNTVPITTISRPAAIFNLASTNPFINTETPLVIRGSGNIYQSGGAGCHTASISSVLSGIVLMSYPTSGGIGMSYPHAINARMMNPDNNNEGWQVLDSIPSQPMVGLVSAAGFIFTGWNHVHDYTNRVVVEAVSGFGGRWGFTGTRAHYTVDDIYNRRGPFGEPIFEPGLLFELDDPDSTRFPNLSSLESCLDLTEFVGKVNGFTKAEWNVPYSGSTKQENFWYGTAVSSSQTKLFGANHPHLRVWDLPIYTNIEKQPVKN